MASSPPFVHEHVFTLLEKKGGLVKMKKLASHVQVNTFRLFDDFKLIMMAGFLRGVSK